MILVQRFIIKKVQISNIKRKIIQYFKKYQINFLQYLVRKNEQNHLLNKNIILTILLIYIKLKMHKFK